MVRSNGKRSPTRQASVLKEQKSRLGKPLISIVDEPRGPTPRMAKRKERESAGRAIGHRPSERVSEVRELHVPTLDHVGRTDSAAIEPFRE